MARLLLYFHNRQEYNRAKDFFASNMSEFAPDDCRDNFSCLIFHEDVNIDALELALCDELTNNDFETFYFLSD